MFDFLWSRGVCPACRTRGARLLWGMVKCRNPACVHRDFATQLEPPPARLPPSARPAGGGFDPRGDAVELRYVNRLGEERIFTAERSSLRRKGEHITARLAPAGGRVSLARKWLRNLAEVEGLISETREAEGLWQSLSPVERQIVGYHRKRKSTSPRYEAVLRKYPGLAEG